MVSVSVTNASEILWVVHSVLHSGAQFFIQKKKKKKICIAPTQPFWVALSVESRVCYRGNMADRQTQWALTYYHLTHSTANQNGKLIHCHRWDSNSWSSGCWRTSLTTRPSPTPNLVCYRIQVFCFTYIGYIDVCIKQHKCAVCRIYWKLLVLQCGLTALHIASAHGHTGVVSLLLEYKAYINATTDVSSVQMMNRPLFLTCISAKRILLHVHMIWSK
jgi:hypothetical protein